MDVQAAKVSEYVARVGQQAMEKTISNDLQQQELILHAHHESRETVESQAAKLQELIQLADSDAE